jgi:hypothetical protein
MRNGFLSNMLYKIKGSKDISMGPNGVRSCQVGSKVGERLFERFFERLGERLGER